MCGIVGAIGNYNNNECLKVLNELKDRGPDGYYSLKKERFYLGISRLSIVAPQNTELPFINENEDVFCVVNGEVYNYLEIRADLIKKGHVFKTEIDTEVILHAYEEFDFNFVSKMNGIFSIIIYDQKLDLIFATRDHLGIKPLYYTNKEGGIYFCSLAKLLAQLITPESRINNKNLIKLYYRQSIPEPETIYNDVYSLPSGSYAIVQNNRLNIKKYFQITCSPIKVRPSVDEFLNIFRKVIQRQSVFDNKKVAIAQSDGVDSMLLGKLLDIESLVGYYIPFNPKQSEYPNSKDFNYKITNVDYVKYVNEAYNKWIGLSDQPPMDGFNTFLLSYGIRQNTKVLYSGLGADELFNGYAQFNFLHQVTSKEELIEKFLNITKVFPEEWLFALTIDYGFNFIGIKNEIKHTICVETNECIENGNLLRELLIKYYLTPCLLRDADNNSMHNGIELRVPYLDLDILNYSLSFNYKNFIVNNENKLIIKSTLNKLLGYSYIKNKEGFTLDYRNFLIKEDLIFNDEIQNNGYRNWCLKNTKKWFSINNYEDCNFNSK